jgi:predicted amidohydrolase
MRLVLIQPALALRGDNFERIVRSLENWQSTQPPLDGADLLVLPEHWCTSDDPDAYLEQVRALARRGGCHVVGGSHHVLDGGARFNRGVVVGPGGELLQTYDKLRPYGQEREFVTGGSRHGSVRIDGHWVLVLLCADFWFFDLIQRAPVSPELICVPALSVSRKPTPEYSRALWRHLSTSRAYELACYVGISDWAHESELPTLRSSGVAGMANPIETDPARFFRPVEGGVTSFHLSFDHLEEFRRDRLAQGFLWQVDAEPGPQK